MNSEINIIDRFKFFFGLLGISKSEFAIRLKMPNQNVNKLLDTLYVIKLKSYEICELGCNINWLYTGVGKVTADNENGYYLNKNVPALTADGYLRVNVIKQRIIDWIEFNYKNIDNFYKLTNNSDLLVLIQFDTLLEINKVIPNSIYTTLYNEGCSLKWLLRDDDIIPFNNNQKGVALKHYFTANKKNKILIKKLNQLKVSYHYTDDLDTLNTLDQ